MISGAGFRAADTYNYSSKKFPASKSPSPSSARENPFPSVDTADDHTAKENTPPKGYVMNFNSANGNSGTLYWGDDSLAAVGGVGGTVNVKYHESSTEDDPVVIAWGVDSKGKEYEEIIHLNDVDVHSATPAEMIALNAHLSKSGHNDAAESGPGALWTSLGMGNDANQKMDFEQHYRDFISMQMLGNKSNAALYQYELERYLFFEKQNAG